MNSFYKSFVLAILAITSYSYAHEYQCNFNHPGVSHEEAHARAHLKETLIISQPNLKYSLFLQTSRLILKEAYTRIGQKIEFEILPVERSLDLANEGVTDGELARISGLQSAYPNLIQIPVSITSSKVFAYSKIHNFPVEGWQSLKSYKIDFMYGFKFVEQNTKGLITTKVKTINQGLRKLNAGRSDLFIGTFAITCSSNKHEFPDIKMLTPAVDEMIMYHYMHKQHKFIADKLEVVLKKMKQNGELELMQKQAKQAFQNKCS